MSAFRQSAHAAGHDPAALPVVVRANTAIGTEVAEDDRPPLAGSPEQVDEDLRRLREMEVDELFFDMNRFSIPVEEQFQALERLRAAAA